ncbi:MAG: hypothetical protein QM579_04520 [Desulfovibrio sp.]|uniref:helix-turn-helix domain-containing protein n=1 Tax=Desulfovibrio sp. TaxID=885 RepID=UPI0039E5127B
MKTIIMTTYFRADIKNEERFFESLRDSIKASGVAQAEISRQTGIQQKAISRFLDGSQPTLGGANVIKILTYLGGQVVFSDAAPTICLGIRRFQLRAITSKRSASMMLQALAPRLPCGS